jgi:hypothetical protein
MGLRERTCGACVHPQRHLIELGMVHRLTFKVLSWRFGLGVDCLFRHQKYHLTPQAVAAIACAMAPSDIDLEQLRKDQSEGLLSSLVVQRARLQLMCERAVEERALGAAASIEKAYSENLRQTSQLLGMITQHSRVDIRSTQLLISPDYLQLKLRSPTPCAIIPRRPKTSPSPCSNLRRWRRRYHQRQAVLRTP